MDKLEKRLLFENEMGFAPLPGEKSQIPKSSKRKAKLITITCEFEENSPMIIDFASELRKVNGEEREYESPFLSRENSPERGKRSEVGINRMTGVLRNIEAMFNKENDLMDGYDMDDDFIDEDDEVPITIRK